MQLTNRAKKTDKSELSLFERSCLPSLATGLGITIKHFFKRSLQSNILNKNAIWDQFFVDIIS